MESWKENISELLTNLSTLMAASITQTHHNHLALQAGFHNSSETP